MIERSGDRLPVQVSCAGCGKLHEPDSPLIFHSLCDRCAKTLQKALLVPLRYPRSPQRRPQAEGGAEQ